MKTDDYTQRKYLFIIRGLPGAGKSDLGGRLAPFAYAANDFFMHRDGTYHFDQNRIRESHDWCRKQVADALLRGYSCAVTNTFCQRWEMEPYIEMAEKYGATYVVIDLFDADLDDVTLARRSPHNVTPGYIAGQRRRYHHSWRRGNPLPPWMRDDAPAEYTDEERESRP